MDDLGLVLVSSLCIYVGLLVVGFRHNPWWAVASVGWLIASFLTAGLVAWVTVGPDAPAMAGMTLAFIALGFLVVGPPIALILAIVAAARRPRSDANGSVPAEGTDRRPEPVYRFLHPDA